ncbi:MAG: hypothetical protein H3C47_03365 [Candidatus Cloacimonetes bacterium]|nr:hypothetical protein [Candidatus Cloacimonadota bacterium]
MVWYLLFVPLLLICSGCNEKATPTQVKPLETKIIETTVTEKKTYPTPIPEAVNPAPADLTKIDTIPAPDQSPSTVDEKRPPTLPEILLAYSREKNPVSQTKRLSLVARIKQDYKPHIYDPSLVHSLKEVLISSSGTDKLIWLRETAFLFPMNRTSTGLRPYEIRDLIREISPDSKSDMQLLDVFLQGEAVLQDAVYNHLMKRYGQNFGYNHELWKRMLSKDERTQ